MKKIAFVVLFLVSAAIINGCAEIIVGPLIGGPIGSAVEKAIHGDEKKTAPHEESRGTPPAEDR